MKELGNTSIEEHQDIVNLIAQYNWHSVALVSGDFVHTKHEYHFFENSVEAGKWLAQLNIGNAAVLVKGSRATAMEKVLPA
jgi:UDP-N-acetylmuramoyl-tripeptide--D-alanyl-D-alanine ligase